MVRLSTALSSVTIFIWRVATWLEIELSFLLIISLKAPHSPRKEHNFSMIRLQITRCQKSNQIKSNQIEPKDVKCLKVYLRYCQHATIQMGIEIVDVPKFVDLHGKRWLVSPSFSFSVSSLEHRWWKLPHPRSKQPRWFAVRGHYGISIPKIKFKYRYLFDINSHQVGINFLVFKSLPSNGRKTYRFLTWFQICSMHPYAKNRISSRLWPALCHNQ